MAASNGGFLHSNPPAPAPTLLPPWLSNSNAASTMRPSSPSVTLSLSPSTVPATPIPWLQPERGLNNTTRSLGNLAPQIAMPTPGENTLASELMECCRELEDLHRAWVAHKKDSAWGLIRTELQLESEKARKRLEKMDEIEAKISALREEQKVTLERIEAEYREQLAGLRRDAEAKEQKLAEQWTAKHMRLSFSSKWVADRGLLSLAAGKEVAD